MSLGKICHPRIDQSIITVTVAALVYPCVESDDGSIKLNSLAGVRS